MNSINPYAQLCTEFYDLTNIASQEEISFFLDHVKHADAPILEPMCGSGRLLIPLAQAGINIEGVDYSQAMLAHCTQKLNELGLHIPIHNQSIESLSLPKQYGAIIIPVASFQLLYRWDIALEALKNFYHYLKPNGFILIDTFVPWNEICSPIHENSRVGDSKYLTTESFVTCDVNTVIKAIKKSYVKRDEQQCFSTIIYEKIQNNTLIKTETEEYRLRWYYHYEMLLLLEKIGFTDISSYKVEFEKDPQGTIYKCYKKS